MSIKGNMTRREAIHIVGEAAVDAVDAQNCDFTNRVQSGGDTLVEFSASVPCVDTNGIASTLIAYYYQEQSDVDAVESLDQLDWIVAGYAIF